MLLTLITAAAVLASPDTGKKVTFQGDAGLVNVNGNSDVTTLSLGNKLGIRLGAWSIGQTFGLAYAKNNDSVTASFVHASLRGDRAFSPHVGIYLLTEFDRNRFAGVDSRIAPSAGVAAVLVADSSNLLRIEVGGGYTWEHATAPNPDRTYAAGRAALSFHHRLRAKSAFEQNVEVLPDLNHSADIRINSETALTAPITNGIAMKASYVIHYAGLPEPGFKKVDRILTTGIQITL